MKILAVSGSVMLHLEHDEAATVADVLRHAPHPHPLAAEIVRQLDICLQHPSQTNVFPENNDDRP